MVTPSYRYRSGDHAMDLPWNVLWSGATGNGSTDDTAAIQAAITTATASGTVSASIYFPPGVYLIGGALQDTGAFNAQILLPNVSTGSNQITIRLLGASRPPYAFHGTGTPTTQGYSIIKSTLTGASGTAALISAGNGTPPTQTNISVVVENLITICPDNPTFTAWNLSCAQGGAIRDLQITTASGFAGSGTQPTHTNSYGIKLPQPYNSNYTYVDGLSVGYFANGVKMGELCIVRGLILGLCPIGLELPSSIHASMVVDMHQSGCARGVKVTGLHYCDVLQYDAEHYDGVAFASWQNPVYDFDDASNFYHGAFRWFIIGNDGSGPSGWSIDNTFLLNGGSGGTFSQIGASVASGTVTSVALTVPAEFSVAGSPITSSGTLAITKANQAANLVYAGPASGGAAAPTFRALVAADVPASSAHYLVIGSSHSTPLIFGDLIQTTAGDDLVYTT